MATRPRPHRQHAAASVARGLGLSIRRLCREHHLPRCVLYLAIDRVEWARREVRDRLGADLSTALIGPDEVRP